MVLVPFGFPNKYINKYIYRRRAVTKHGQHAGYSLLRLMLRHSVKRYVIDRGIYYLSKRGGDAGSSRGSEDQLYIAVFIYVDSRRHRR
jgi:hypothetical protein